ncbi:LysM peptidoglycan-binding domain-containing protein [Deinococcus sp.]|uniref:C40 family peptidase n=1 Tax=Deinococcus sp. TaxID=47478 RepID=UPI003CC65AC8
MSLPSTGLAADLAGYKVQPGDTAYSLARRWGVDVAALLALNHLSSPNLAVGQTLAAPSPTAQTLPVAQVPAPVTHTVQAGQTLYGIARLYGRSADEVQSLNHLSTPDLKVGQVLLLPAGALPLAGIASAGSPTPTPSSPQVARQIAPPTPSIETAPPAPAAPQPAPAASNPAQLAPVNAAVHTVQPGQTLYGIARLYGLKPEALGTLNHLVGDQLRPGQALQLPAGAAALRVSLPAPSIGALSVGTLLPADPAALPQVQAAQVPDTDWRSAALSLVGVPYRYGGSSRSGTDCSGLVLQVFGPLGLKLPRQSALQAQVGVPVEQSALQAGDLVFFDTQGRGEVTHVGIYLGDGAFVNANSYAGRVEVNQLSDKYFAQRYLWARRILGVLAQAN